MTKAPPPLFILSYGPDSAAAHALALACAITDPVPAFDPATLNRALKAGRRCVVVWSDPQTTLASALRDAIAPAVASAAWISAAGHLTNRPGKAAKAKLILVDAGAVRASNSAALGQILPLSAALPALPAAPVHDTAALLAALMLPLLPDLQSAWDRLRSASLTADLSPLPQNDLSGLAALGRDLEKTVQERGLLRAQLQALGKTLDAHSEPSLPAQSPPREISLLRDQLLALSGLWQASDGSSATSEPRTAEIGLLRDHIAYLQSDLGLGGAVPPAAAALPATAQASIEAAIARLLADLVRETDRRILAEREVQAGRSTLHSLAMDGLAMVGRAPPTRIAVAPRPLT